MHHTDSILDLVRRWREEAETLRRYGGEASAVTLEVCAAELQEVLRAGGEEPLTLSEAAEITGYSADHLGRLVRDGKLPNAGRHGAPRILRRDLPVKPGRVAPPVRSAQIDRTQIVRSAINAGD